MFTVVMLIRFIVLISYNTTVFQYVIYMNMLYQTVLEDWLLSVFTNSPSVLFGHSGYYIKGQIKSAI